MAGRPAGRAPDSTLGPGEYEAPVPAAAPAWTMGLRVSSAAGDKAEGAASPGPGAYAVGQEVPSGPAWTMAGKPVEPAAGEWHTATSGIVYVNCVLLLSML